MASFSSAISEDIKLFFVNILIEILEKDGAWKMGGGSGVKGGHEVTP